MQLTTQLNDIVKRGYTRIIYFDAMSRTAATTSILLIFASSLAFASCYVAASSNAVSSLVKRESFARPENCTPLRNCIRSKRQASSGVQDFQDYLLATKQACGAELGYRPEELRKSFLYEQSPTPRDKCLMHCVLKKTKIMDSSNKVSGRSIARIASKMSNNNALVVSIAMATADNCNRSITATEPCEAAYQINKFIGNEMKARKIKIFY